MTWAFFFTASLLGTFLCLDRVYAQTLVSRPIVTGTVIGLVLKDLQTGVMIGALLELLWIDQSPIGTMVPPNDTVSTVLITSCCITAGNDLGVKPLGKELIALSILLLAPVAILAQRLDIFLFAQNDRNAKRALAHAMRGDIQGVQREHLMALLKVFILSAILIVIFLPVGYHALIQIYPRVPDRIIKALTCIYYFIPILGVAVALNTIHLKRMLPLFYCIFIILVIIFDYLLK